MILYRQTDTPHGRPSAVALGCFDGVHRGHEAVIQRVVSAGKDGLMPAVFTFENNTMKTLAGESAPEIMTFSDKTRTLWSLGVEGIFLENFKKIRALTPEAFVRDILCKKYRAAQVCCGFNYRFGAGSCGTVEELKALGEKYGLTVTVCDAVREEGRPISSTWIREAVLEGEMEQVRRLLGRPFRYDFPVVRGSQRGRTMGAPTINQLFTYGFILPRFGVYASSVKVNGVRRHAVTNVGTRPTIQSEIPLSETWIPDFFGDLYGQEVEVSLHRYLRPEQKFESMEAMRQAIQQDGERAKKVLEGLAL